MEPDNRLERLYSALASLPKGKVTSYGELGKMIGLSRQARWIGKQLSQLPADTQLPWHRVINAQGQSSFPVDCPKRDKQLSLLKQEGVEVTQAGRIPKRFFL